MWIYVVSVQRKEAVDHSTWKGLFGLYSSLDKVKEINPSLVAEYPDEKYPTSWLIPDHPYNDDDSLVYVSTRYLDEGCAEPYQRQTEDK